MASGAGLLLGKRNHPMDSHVSWGKDVSRGQLQLYVELQVAGQ